MRPAVWVAAALCVGMAGAGWLRPHPVLALAALCVCGAWAAREPNRRRAAAALLLAAACLGALRYAYDQTAGRGAIAAWEGRRATLTGTVVTEPELQKPRGVSYTVSVEQADGAPASGRVFVTQRTGTAPGYGERVQLTGALKLPSGPRLPGGFDRAAYLARQGTYLTADAAGEVLRLGPGALNPLLRAAVAARIRLEGVLRGAMPPRDAALMAGLLLGSRSDLPDDLKEAFKASGVFHLLAVSGGNIAMILMPLLVLLARCGLSRRRAAAAAIPVLVFFVFLTGATPSVLRAGLMALLVLVGDLFGRERNTLNTLGAATLLLLLRSPSLLFDLGFLFSVAATLGILLFARPVERWLEPRLAAIFGKKPGAWLAAGLSVTLAAQLLVEPISLHAFGAFSAVAPLANLLVLAFLEPVVQVGAVAMLSGLVVPPAAWLLALPVRAGLWLLVFVVKATSAVPGAFLQFQPVHPIWVLVWYAGLVILASPVLRRELLDRGRNARLVILANPRQARRRAAAGVVCAAVLLAAGGWTWQRVLAGSPDTLLVAFLDVGQGDAIIVRAPGGESMLIDAGPALDPNPARGWAGYDAGADVVVPALERLGVVHLDYLVLTHPDQDHAGGGAAVLEQVPVSRLLVSGANPKEEGFTRALAAAGERGVLTDRPQAGQVMALGPDVSLEVLNPAAVPVSGTRSDDNSNCIALRLRYRRVTILFACDLEPESEERLLAEEKNLGADVLKVAHHGSGKSSTEPFLNAVRPRWAVISAGAGNLYGHPHQAALDRLAAAGAELHRTDRHGTVTLRTDGLTVRLGGERGSPADDRYRPLGLLGRRLFFAW